MRHPDAASPDSCNKHLVLSHPHLKTQFSDLVLNLSGCLSVLFSVIKIMLNKNQNVFSIKKPAILTHLSHIFCEWDIVIGL